MSQPTPSPAARPEKIMSSRLMTMKFMQRAAASSTPTTRTTAASSDAPPSKRQRTALSAPSSELDAIRAALDAEEAKRSEARDRQAAAAGGARETKWVLSLVEGGKGVGVRGESGWREESGLRVLTAGYSEIDDGDGYVRERWVPSGVGRRSFGRFNREVEKRQNAQSDRSSSSADDTSGAESEENDGDSDGPSRANDLIPISTDEAVQHAKAERKAEKMRINAEAARVVGMRKNKAVKLNTLSSISGGGNSGKSSGGKSRAGNPNMQCFNCGKMGHARKDCVENSNGKRKVEFGGEEGSAKRSRSSLKP